MELARWIAILILGIVVAALLAFSFIQPILLIYAVVALVFLAGLCFESWRYNGGLESSRPNGDFQANGERFIDPESGASVTVYVNSLTGGRKYVHD